MRLAVPTALAWSLGLGWDLAAQDSASGPGAEEGFRIFGSVVDRATGEPVPSAAIAFVRFDSEDEPSWSGESDADGRFRTDVLALGAYRLSVEVIPWSPLSHLLVLSEEGVGDMRVEMVRVEYELDPIVVSARRISKLEREGFYERRQRGSGHFINREDIEERFPARVSDLFRGIPGTRVITGSFGRSGGILLRGGCTPLVVLDGVRLSNPVRIDELFAVEQLEGIEVYQGSSAPIQYVGISNCGVIMLWSRDPMSAEGRDFSWRRFLVAAGIGVLVVLGAR